MSVTNLTYTKWTIVSQPDVSTAATYNLDFQTNGEQGSKISISATGALALRGFIYTLSTDGSLFPAEVKVYNPTLHEWSNTNYRTIIITGGADVENANLIAWLEANATQDTSFPGEVSCYYKNNWIGGFSSSGSHKFDTAGTWLEDDITIKYSRPSGGSITVLPLSVTSNGTYTASSGTAYSPVTVNVSGGTDTVVDFIENHGTLSSFEHSTITTIGSGAFFFCSNLTTVNFPLCKSIGFNAFSSCTKLTTISFPICETIGSYAFYYCSSLTTVSFPACTLVSNNAFYSCKNLTTANFPVCSSVGSNAFYYCSSLTTANFPSCTSIGNYAFFSCRTLTTASFSLCRSIGNYAFNNCSSLSEANFPSCTYISTGAFSSCGNLSNISFPVCKTIAQYAFYSCKALTTASFPKCSSIGSSAFSRCFNLVSLYLLGSSVVSIPSWTVFASTPIAGYTASTGGVYGSIYVPSSLYSSYIRLTAWNFFSSRFVSV